MPTNTDLVSHLPADFEVFGQAVATSMADLLGGTTGQVLKKNTNADMDFVWGAIAGDIEGVTAGVGITGGGTSGTVTITNDMATTITTNGDLLYGTGSGTYTRRGIGSTGQVLTVTGGVPTWSTPAGGGKVLQVVTATYSTDTDTSSTSFVDTGLTATITPSSATSKVLVMFTQQARIARTGVDQGGGYQLLRGATSILNLGNGGYESQGIDTGNSSSVQLRAIISGAYLDSPATTSATTYKTQFKVYSTASSGQATINENSAPATLLLLEIGA
jgi:hypothetical protein